MLGPKRCTTTLGSAELKGPGELLRIRPGIADLGPKLVPTPDEAKPKMPGRAHKPAQTDSDRFQTGFGVLRPHSKILNCEIAQPSLEDSWRHLLRAKLKIASSFPRKHQWPRATVCKPCLTSGRPTGHESAIYERSYNSCGCNFRVSEVRSGSFGVDMGPVSSHLSPASTPNDPDRTSNRSHMSCSHI